MKVFLKKQLAAFLAIAMSFTTMAFTAAAEGEYDLVEEVGYAFDYVDDTKGYVVNANEIADGITTVAGVDSTNLLTPEFVEMFGTAQAAKSALVTLLANSLAVYYSTDSADFENNLADATDKTADVLGELAFDSEEWFRLVVGTRLDSKSAAMNKKTILAYGSKAEVFGVLDSILIDAMNKLLKTNEYAAMQDKLAYLGWSAEKIVAALRAVANVADVTRDAEFELAKAAARSDVKVEGETLSPYELGMDWEYSVNCYLPEQITGETRQFKMTILGDARATNAADFYTSNPELVTLEANDEEMAIDITVNPGVRGEAYIVIMRQNSDVDENGFPTDWIYREKLIVCFDGLDTPAKPVWDNTTLKWEAVDYAETYKVDLYKDDVLVETVTVDGDTKLPCEDLFKKFGHGEYRAQVTAYGLVPMHEYSSPSAKSGVYDYSEGLAQVEKPTLVKNDEGDYIASWTKVDNATSYVVYLYQGNVLIDTINVGDIDTLKLTDNIKKSGTYYVAVKAVADEEAGLVSEKSAGLLVTINFTISGRVVLQNVDGSIQADNSKTEVSILENSSVTPVLTDIDGKYTLENVPESSSYTIVFKNKDRYYIEKRVADVCVEETVVLGTDEEPLLMYFGDVNDAVMVIINYADIGYMAKFLGVSDTDSTYDENLDVNSDGNIYLEDFRLLMSNVGKNAYN